MAQKEDIKQASLSNENYWYFLSSFIFLTLISLKLSTRLHYSVNSLSFALYLLTYFSGSILLSTPFLFLQKFPKNLYAFGLFILTVFNHEHIIINNGHLNFGFWHLGTSAVFLNSLVHLGLLINTLYLTTILSLSSLIGHLILKNRAIKIKGSLIIEVSLLIFIFDYFLPKDISVPQWQQSSFLNSLIKKVETKKVTLKKDQSDLRPSVQLKNESIKIKPDIYIFILESFSQDYLDSGLATRLKGLQNNGLVFKNFITNQQQTNRGLYSLFCGDYPNLVNLEAKSDILISSINKQKRDCLPKALKSLGYTNYFLQSAPLSFMSKEQFTRIIGFDYALGSEGYYTKQIISPWGVDDQTTMESVLKTSQSKDSPKLISALTISTHYPYKTKKSQGNLYEAIKYTDHVISLAVGRILDTNKNALIFITSDESRPLSPSLPLLHSNKGLFFALGKGIQPGEIKPYYSLVDFPDILEKILQERQEDLRTSPKRPIYFGNVYTNRLYSLDPISNDLTTCNRQLECVSHKNIQDIFNYSKGSFKRVNEEKLETLKSFLEKNEWTFERKLITRKNFKLKAQKTFNIFREFKLTPDKNFLKVKLKSEGPVKMTYTTYECGRPKTQKIEHFRAGAGETKHQLFFVNDNTQCLSLYLKSFNSQLVEKLDIELVNLNELKND